MPSLKERCQQKIKMMDTRRSGYYSHWRELADYYMPRRYRWLVSTNEQRQPSFNTRIIDSTGTLALRVLASGMMSGVTSPSRPWFKLKLDQSDKDENSPINRWLAECERRMLRVFAESNFYNIMAQMYFDLGLFGTAPIIIREDFEDVIRCHNSMAGEYYLESDNRGDISRFARRFVMTLEQIAAEYGEEKLSQSDRQEYKNGGQGLFREKIVCEMIEPNVGEYDVPEKFRWRELHWVEGESDDVPFLRKKGFFEKPFIAPRWDVVGNDAYGASPAMDALGDVKQLQQEQKRKGQAIDKMVTPPMLADIVLKNQPLSLLPGGITFVAGLQNNHGMKPAYEVQPRIQELMLDIAEVQKRVKDVFFNQLFLMISQLDTVRTATEIDARRAEQLIQLGPVLERLNNEALNPVIERTFGIMYRGGLLPDPPEDIVGQPMKIEYISMMAEAQAATATSGIERVLAQAGNMAAVDPTVLDVIDMRETLQMYGSLLHVDPRLIRNDDEVREIQAQRQEAQENLASQEATTASVDAAKTLSETDVGGGQNALQAMIGGGPM